MRSSIDSAGRVVIPKPIRDRLGMDERQAVEVHERDGVIELVPVSTPMELVDRGDGPVAVPADSASEVPPLTDEMVRQALERTRR